MTTIVFFYILTFFIQILYFFSGLFFCPWRTLCCVSVGDKKRTELWFIITRFMTVIYIDGSSTDHGVIRRNSSIPGDRSPIHLSVYPQVCLSIYLSIYPSVYVCHVFLPDLSYNLVCCFFQRTLFIVTSLYLSIYLSIYVFIYLSVYLSVY